MKTSCTGQTESQVAVNPWMKEGRGHNTEAAEHCGHASAEVPEIRTVTSGRSWSSHPLRHFSPIPLAAKHTLQS